MRKKPESWLPWVGFVVLVGGYLIQFGVDRQRHADLEATVRKLEAQSAVTAHINYSEHSRYWEEILAAERVK